VLVQTRELVGALKAARLFASTDATRPNLNCVHVEAVDNALRVTSTDGHTLWCAEIPAQDSAPATAWNANLADVDIIVRELARGGTIEAEISLVKRQVHDLVFEQVSENFPPYSAVIPALKACEPGRYLPEFAAEYVSRACEAFRLYARGFAPTVPKLGTRSEKQKARDRLNAHLAPPIAWRIGGALDPAIFYSPKFPCALAIVMPRRGEDSTATGIENFVARVRVSKRAA